MDRKRVWEDAHKKLRLACEKLDKERTQANLELYSSAVVAEQSACDTYLESLDEVKRDVVE